MGQQQRLGRDVSANGYYDKVKMEKRAKVAGGSRTEMCGGWYCHQEGGFRGGVMFFFGRSKVDDDG